MEYYLPLKLLHILSATVLFGTGLGTAFSLWRADRSGDRRVIAHTANNVVLADWLFTTPAVIIQPITGLAMVHLASIPITTPWLLASIALYLVAGACWLPVVWLQLHIKTLVNKPLPTTTPLIDDHPDVDVYRRVMRWWYTLGWPAFVSVMMVFYLMVFKPV